MSWRVNCIQQLLRIYCSLHLIFKKMHFKTFLTRSAFFTVVFLLVGSAEYSLASVLSKRDWTDPGFRLRSMVSEYLPGESYARNRNILHARFSHYGKYDQEIAKNKLKKYIEWREAENIDSILEENWTDMDVLYPYRTSVYTFPDSYNSEGRTHVLSIDLGKWDIRVAAYSTEAEQKRFVRFVSGKMMEDVNRDGLSGRVLGERPPYPNIVQYEIVINMKDFVLEKHACLQCSRLLMEIIEKLGKHWSEAISRIYLANAPDFSPYVHSWIEEFQRGSGISVEIRQGQVLLSRPKNDKVYSLVVFRDWVWTIEE